MQTIDPKRKLPKPVSYHLMSLTLLVATVLLIDVIVGPVNLNEIAKNLLFILKL